MQQRHIGLVAGLSLLLVIGMSLPALAQPGWEHLGSARVDGRIDHDKITVNNGRTYRAIQLRVRGGAIQFDRVTVRYGNGQQQEIQLRSQIPAGGQSRVIDLPGSRRAISRVELWYRKANWGSNSPKVDLFGMR